MWLNKEPYFLHLQLFYVFGLTRYVLLHKKHVYFYFYRLEATDEHRQLFDQFGRRPKNNKTEYLKLPCVTSGTDIAAG
jgi:hypothetical protein